jgi:hypothetical protein
MRPCLKRIQPKPNVPLAYVSVYAVSDIFHTLAYTLVRYAKCDRALTLDIGASRCGALSDFDKRLPFTQLKRKRKANFIDSY